MEAVSRDPNTHTLNRSRSQVRVYWVEVNREDLYTSGWAVEREVNSSFTCDMHCSVYSCITLRSVSLPQRLVQVYPINRLRNHSTNPLKTL